MFALVDCSSEVTGDVINLSILADDTVNLSLVRTLTLTATGASSGMTSYTVSGLQKETRIQVVPSTRSGDLSLRADALDGTGLFIGQGSVDVTITGATVTKTITLVTPGAASVSPAMATLTRGHSMTFTATQPVTWSASAGTIDSQGILTAPVALPTSPITVTATSIASGLTATATVTVADYAIELFAGALGGPGTADGVGPEARLNTPTAMAVASDGSVYVANLNSCVISKIIKTSNGFYQSATVAGGGPGSICASVDGDQATARFGVMRGMSIDNTKHRLFVSDDASIRIVDLMTNATTTLAVDTSALGGNADAIYRGIVYDDSISPPVLYVVRPTLHIITKIILTTPATPIETVVAGSLGSPGSADGVGTAAAFKFPTDVALSGGTLIVGDNGNFTLRKIDIASRTVSTVAGTASISGSADGNAITSRLAGPKAVIANTTLANLIYVMDTPSDLIRSFDLNTGSLSTIAGVANVIGSLDSVGNMSTFNAPAGGAFSSQDNSVFVGDQANHEVRRMRVDGNNAVTTAVGRAAQPGTANGVGMAARFKGLSDITSIDGHIFYVTDGETIRKIDYDSGSITTYCGDSSVEIAVDGPIAQARFRGLSGLVQIGTRLIVLEINAVRSIDLGTGMVSTPAGTSGSPGIMDGIGSQAQLSVAFAPVSDGADLVHFVDGSAVRRIRLSTNEVTTVAGDVGESGSMDGIGTAARLGGMDALAQVGNLIYVFDGSPAAGIDNRLHTFDPVTLRVTTVAGKGNAVLDGPAATAGFRQPQGLLPDGKGGVWLFETAVLRHYDPTTQMVTTVAGVAQQQGLAPGPFPGRLNTMIGAALTADGDIVAVDSFENSIVRIRMPQP